MVRVFLYSEPVRSELLLDKNIELHTFSVVYPKDVKLALTCYVTGYVDDFVHINQL